ncbi:MAG: hypothetical protein K2X69_09080 [Silvanigrellaceae bacterium]|nr:hypothetical protein [Silvanigrellaceae bacterium]
MQANKRPKSKYDCRIMVTSDVHKKIKLISVENEISMGNLIEMSIPCLNSLFSKTLPADIINEIKNEQKKRF